MCRREDVGMSSLRSTWCLYYVHAKYVHAKKCVNFRMRGLCVVVEIVVMEGRKFQAFNIDMGL